MQINSTGNLQVVSSCHIHSDCDFVATAICLSKVIRRAVAHDTSIDHDAYLVAQLFGFVHPVRRQNNTWITQLLYHFEKASSGDGVDAGCWLVEKFDLGRN